MIRKIISIDLTPIEYHAKVFGFPYLQLTEIIAYCRSCGERRSALDAEIKEVELALKQAHRLSGIQDWFTTGQHRFRMSVTNGRRILDEAALKEEMDEICAVENIDPIDIIAMLRRHEREGMLSARLTVTQLN